MTREEAIEIVKTRFDKWALADEDLTALQVLGLIDTESEDERIRKALINVFAAHKDYEIFFGVSVKDIIAYLEKQKEQKPVEYLDKDKVYAIMKKLHDLSFSPQIPIDSDEFKKINEITSDVRSLLDYLIEQKPASGNSEKPNNHAEWSEEDEWKRNELLKYLEEKGDYRSTWYSWLKSLRPQPHWKPSEEQIGALERAIVKIHTVNDIGILAELRDNLKKL